MTPRRSSDALSNIGAAEFQTGTHDGQLKLKRALALAQHHGLEEHAGRAFVLLAVGSIRQRMFELGGGYLETGLEYCSDRGLDTWRLYLLACRARVELALGRWDDAADSAALVLRDPRSAPLPRGWAQATLGLVRARRGDPAARAEAAWLSGENADVDRVTGAALSLARDRQAHWAVAELSYWRWQAGLPDEFAQGRADDPYTLAIAGEWARAAELWKKIGCPYEEALALAEADDQLAMRQAIDQLRDLGARPAAGIVAHRLRGRGVRGLPRGPRPRTRQNGAGLTARELEVLALLTEGLRNAQIAQRLVVSEKTIDHHVSSVLRKLGVRTRGEASAEALRLELVGGEHQPQDGVDLSP